MDKPSICFISFYLYHLITREGATEGIGGPEVQTLFIAKELAKRGYDITAITFPFDQNQLREKPPFRFIRMDDRSRIPFLGRFYRRFFGVWKSLLEADADFYYTNNSSFLLSSIVLFALLHRRKVIFCGSSNTDFDPKQIRHNARDRMLFHWGLRRCDAVLVQNEFQQALLKKNFGREGVLFYNGLPGKERPNAGKKSIIWSGGVREVKKPHLFVELAAKFPRERFVMVGGLRPSTNGALRDYYNDLLNKAKMVPNLRLTGYIPFDETEKYFEDAGVLINTSDVEGFPNAFLQAWSRGIPVISFVGLDDTFQGNGLGVVAKDPDDMAVKLQELLDGKLSFSAEKIKAFFDEHFTIEKTVDVLEETMNVARRH